MKIVLYINIFIVIVDKLIVRMATRRNKNYKNVTQQHLNFRFRNIRRNLWHHIQTVTRRFGLTVSSITLEPISEHNATSTKDDIRILINEDPIINEHEKVFDSLKTLDRANLSYNNYKSVGSNFNYVPKIYRMPGINRVVAMKKRVDEVF